MHGPLNVKFYIRVSDVGGGNIERSVQTLSQLPIWKQDRTPQGGCIV